MFAMFLAQGDVAVMHVRLDTFHNLVPRSRAVTARRVPGWSNTGLHQLQNNHNVISPHQ